ncbi:MAG: hypothetical protein HeimAB125_14060 [Candidatus Heimdallarchaeota archaeon AB_125]|nr:MAG: hypothetical protein HeimAB125_14060 [Candidatus Heimdallarchaeota archaeon AB_125]
MFELINMIEIKIDVGYILEELENISYEVKNLGNEGVKIHEEMKHLYSSYFSKYKNKLAAFLSPRESSSLTEKIKKWLLKLADVI